jgi:endonuclease YncB( thermonuclease family)
MVAFYKAPHGAFFFVPFCKLRGDCMHVNLQSVLVLLTLITGISGTALADILTGKVVTVTDGDTISVLDGQQTQHKIRLMGIDCPEKTQPFGQKARDSLSGLVFGRSVSVDWQKQDRYGRIVGKVVVSGQDANLEQVRRGMAWHYKKYEREQEPSDRVTYAETEFGARNARRGLWVDREPIPPWDWRKIRR